MKDSARASAHPPRPLLADPGRCPWCGLNPGGPVCRTCGLTLTGELAARLWHAGTQADHWLDERARLLDQLRHSSAVQPGAQAPAPAPAPAQRTAAPVTPAPVTPAVARPVASPASAGVPPPAPAAVTRPVAPPSSVPPPRPGTTGPAPRRGLGVQAILVGVGSVLLAVAAIAFLAYRWEVLGLVGRSLVVGGLTVGVLAGAALAQRARLGATAEAVAALGVVLVLLDAAAVRATGLAGEGMGVLSYSAVAALLCAVVAGTFGVLARLRAGTIAASLLLPVAPVLAGAHLATRASEVATGAAAVSVGLAAAAAVGLLRAVPSPGGRVLTAERTSLTVTSLLGWCGAAVAALVVTSGDLLLAAGVVAVLALVALAHSVVDARRPGPRAAWAGAAGGAAAVALALVVLDVLPGRWSPLTLPLAVGLLALALAVPARGLPGEAVSAAGGAGRARRTVAGVARPASSGAEVVLALVAAPAALIGAFQLLPALALAHPTWAAGWADPLSSAAGSVATDLDDTLRWTALAGLVVLAGTSLALPWARGRDATAVRVALATLLTGLVVSCLPWQPGAPLAVAVGLALVVAALLVVGCVLTEGAGVLPRHGRAVVAAGLAAASTSVLLAVPGAWANRWTSVPVTLLAAGALLLARRRRPAAGPVLLSAVALACLVCAAAVARWAGLSVSDAALVGAASGALVVTVAVLAPRLCTGERRALLLAGLTPLLVVASTVPLLEAAGDLTAEQVDTVAAPRPQLLLLAALAAALLLALRPLRRVELPETVVGAGVAAALGCALAASAAAQWGPVPVLLALAVAVAVTAVVGAAAGRAGDPRREPVEGVGAAAAGVVLLALLAQDAAAAWGPVLVLAGAAGVLATAPGRRWCVWLCVLLGSLGLWLRLADVGVSAVEAYTLPPAAVLLAITAVGWWKGRGAGTPSGVGGLALALLPTAVTGVTGPGWRAGAVLAVAAALLAVVPVLGRRAVRTGQQRWTGLARWCAAGAVAALLAGPWLRSLRLAAGGGVESTADLADWWVIPVAGVLAAAVVVARPLRLPGSVAPWATAPAVAALTLPLLVALTADHTPFPQSEALQLARVLLVVLVGGVLSVLAANRRRDPVGAGAQVVAITAATLAVLTGLLAGVASGRPVEVLTAPLALVVLATAAMEMERTVTARSWPWVGTGSALLLVPSLLVSLGDSSPWRVAALAAAGVAVLVAGAVLRWQAAVVVGSLVLVTHAVAQLGPWLVVAYTTVPWVSLGLSGAVLLALGARYEHRLRDLRAARLRLSAMR